MPRSAATLLMFDGAAEEAMRFYVSLFNGAEITRIERYGPGEAGTEGSVKTAAFMLGGNAFMCIDSAVKHNFTFTPSISIFVDCETETELNLAFTKLSTGGKVFMPIDNYGFSRQFLP